MEFPHLNFSNSMDGDQDDNNGTTERTGLLSSWIANFPLIRSRPAAATATVDGNVDVNVDVNVNSTTTLGSATSSSGISILVPENVASYGSINITDAGATIPSSRTVDNGNESSVGETVRRNSEPPGATHFIDIEDGEGGENRQHGQEQRRGGFTDSVTANIATANSDDDQQQEPSGETETTNDGEPPRDGAIGNLTRRLRCMFSTITFPIVPLGTIVFMALLWVLYAATSLDLQKSCSHPLHSYALVSFLLVAYLPNHSQVRSQIFNYSRERDGPIRPIRVRMYDQFFHTVCLLYVYTGVMLIQTCRDDLLDKSAFEIAAASQHTHHNSYELTMDDGGGPWNSCEATCPNLYQALSVYVATLELFTFALILPLLFLPCIYLWFLQRATVEADAFSRLQDRLQEEDALLSNGGVTTGEIVDSLEVVKIVSRGTKSDNINNGGINDNENETDNNEELDESEQQQQQQQCWVLPLDTAPNAHTGTKCDTKECCICMTAFDVRVIPGDEVSSSSSSSSSLNPGDAALQYDHKASDKEMGYANSEKDDESDDDDDDDDDDEGSSQKELESVIVRTRCGHLFHKECLKGWVGGMWSASSSNNSNASYQVQQRDWRKRKARQIHCPLCREDLRPGDTSSTSNNPTMEQTGLDWNSLF